MYNIVVVTPTYNRVEKLSKLYDSLKKQEDKEFIWLIIDDGSNDTTKEYVKKIALDGNINIEYVYKDNGGKASALNLAFSIIHKASVSIIVDSDDYLLPEAIIIVKNYLERYSNEKNIGAFFFHYMYSDGNIIKYKDNMIDRDVIMSRYEYDKTNGKHDGCICYFGKVMKEYSYPEYEGEKYMGPTVLQMEMSDRYKIVFSPIVIGVAEYQENGLTKSGRFLRLNSPLGMLYYSGLQQSKQVDLLKRIKYSICAQAYRLISRVDRSLLTKLGLTKYLKAWAFIPGLILKVYWEFKYKKG